MKIFQKITVWLLVFVLNFNLVPLQAQENIDLEDLDMSSVYTSQGEIGQYIIDNIPARLDEMRAILSNKAKKYHTKVGTFRDKTTDLNMSALPPVKKDEAFPKSKFFKQKGSLFRFMLEMKLTALDELFLQGEWGSGDYHNFAVNTVRQLVLLKNQDDVLKQITFGAERTVLSDASYLISYERQNDEFIAAIKDAKALAAECRSYGLERDNDPDCKEAYEFEKYDLTLLERSNTRIKKTISYVSKQINLCMNRVLVPLQVLDTGYKSPEDILLNNEDLNNFYTLCGVDKEELINLILENTVTQEGAYAKASEIAHPKKFWGKVFRGLEYIAPSYYIKKYRTIEEYIEKHPEIQDELNSARREFMEDVSENPTDEDELRNSFYEYGDQVDEILDEAYRKALASVYLTNSFNQSVAQISANLITYGKLFYYNQLTLGTVKNKDTGRYEDVSDTFAAGWHDVAVNRWYRDLPTAKLSQEAIMNSGRTKYQDKEFVNTINAVRFLDNSKKNSEFLLFAMDFVDPVMMLAPLANTGKGIKIVNKAVTAAKDTKVGRAVGNVVKPVSGVVGNITKPVKKAIGQFGNDITNGLGDVMGVKGYGTNYFGMMGKSTNAVGDGFSLGRITALHPTELNISLTGRVDDVVTNTRRGIGFKPQEMPTTLNLETKPIGFNTGNSPLAPKGVITNPTGGIGFKPQNVSGTPTVARRPIGFNRSADEPLGLFNSNLAPQGTNPTRMSMGFKPQELHTSPAVVDGTGTGFRDFTKPNGTKPQAPGFRKPEQPKGQNQYGFRNSADPNAPRANTPDPTPVNTQIVNIKPEDLEKLFKERRAKNLAIQRSFPEGSREYKDWEEWIKLDAEFFSTVKVRPGYGNSPYAIVTNTRGIEKRVLKEDFYKWAEGSWMLPEGSTGISQANKNLIEGYTDVINAQYRAEIAPKKAKRIAGRTEEIARANQQKIIEEFNRVMDSNYTISRDANSTIKNMKEGLNKGCYDANSCKRLAEALDVWRDSFASFENDLLKAYQKTNPNATIEDIRNMLTKQDNFPALRDLFKNDTDIVAFLKGGNIPQFENISETLLRNIDSTDLINFMKDTNTNNAVGSLYKVASKEEQALLISKTKTELSNRLTYLKGKHKEVETALTNAVKKKGINSADKNYPNLYKSVMLQYGDDPNLLKTLQDNINQIESIL